MSNRKHCIRYRDAVDSYSAVRPKSLHVRLSVQASSRLASLQGMAFKFAHVKNFADLFETVCLPALEGFCKAQKAIADADAKACAEIDKVANRKKANKGGKK